MARLRPRAGLLLVAVLLTAGCATQRQVPGTAVAWDARQAALLALPGWSLQGRIAVKSPEGGGQGRLSWDQAGEAARLRVSGPFGAGAWELDWGPSGATLTNGKEELMLAATGPDALNEMLRTRVGWEFPAQHTRYWVLGLAAPGVARRLRFADDGWLAGLEQDGWDVRFDDFVERAGYWMPRKVTVAGEDARLRLVVDRWQPGPAP